TRRCADLPAAGPGPSLLTSWMLARLCGDGPLDELAGLIGDRRTLLVVDGYDGPVADGGRLLHLLACCTNLQVLVTMRTPLPVLGVRAVPLAEDGQRRSEEHTSELQSREDLVC